jgi:methylmalonyl-CoA/ethylmalonyl-CoA epimerase
MQTVDNVSSPGVGICPFPPGVIRRLDHVAVLVRSTEEALEYFSKRLELPVVAHEERPELNVRLTYLSTGNAFLQLIEPLSESGPIAAQLAERGEGIHHICFGADDPVADASALGEGAATPGGGRGRVSAFVPGPPAHGVLLECTGFDLREDIEKSPGALGL